MSVTISLVLLSHGKENRYIHVAAGSRAERIFWIPFFNWCWCLPWTLRRICSKFCCELKGSKVLEARCRETSIEGARIANMQYAWLYPNREIKRRYSHIHDARCRSWQSHRNTPTSKRRCAKTCISFWSSLRTVCSIYLPGSVFSDSFCILLLTPFFEPKLTPEFRKFLSGQRLRWDVSYHLVGWDLFDYYQAISHNFSCVMVLNVYVLRSITMLGAFYKILTRFVVSA